MHHRYTLDEALAGKDPEITQHLAEMDNFGEKSGTALDAWSWHTYDFETPVKPPLATEYLLENTEWGGVGFGAPHHCSLGGAACSLLFMLTRAIWMPSLFHRPMLGMVDHQDLIPNPLMARLCTYKSKRAYI